jgi:hypothetical protein
MIYYSLIFTSITFQRYWTFLQSTTAAADDSDINGSNFSLITQDESNETFCKEQDVMFIKTYLIGINTIVALNLPLLLVMIRLGAKGGICDIYARRHVPSLLYLK